MKNGDMPANPLSGDAYQDFAGYDGTKNTSYNPECQGLTKREHFAVMAMQGIISSGNLAASENISENMAKWAVRHANALLAELDKPHKAGK